MRDVVIVDYARTAFGRVGKGFARVPSWELGSTVVKALVEKTKIQERGGVDGLFVGSAFPDCDTNALGRYIVQAAGLPIDVSGTYVEMQCGSAITALNLAAGKIALGMADVCLVGGVESHSTRVAKFSMCQEPFKFIPPTAIPNRLAFDPAKDTIMLQNSDIMAKKWNISREECDEFSYRSQMLMKEAIETGFTGPEIVPYVYPATKKTPERIIDKDEHPRPDTTLDGLSKLKSVYEGGVTTAGNSSARNDGAAFLLVMSADKAKELGYDPIAKWVMGADIGCEPNLMGVGASYATLKALKFAGLKLSDLDVIECNEAFASQNLLCIKDMQEQTGEKIDMKKWNPHGGAIAIGHPNGASGTRVTFFAMHQLELTGGKYGVATSCCGGGQGTTVILENLRR